MHISIRVFLFVVCATLSAPLRAGDIVSAVEQNYPYQEVAPSYGDAMIQAGRCLEGTPFFIPREDTVKGTSEQIARRIHETVRDLGANAFVLVDPDKGARSSHVKVIPLTCDLR